MVQCGIPMTELLQDIARFNKDFGMKYITDVD